MKITKIEPIMLRLPNAPRIADGAQTLLVVKVHTDEGITGIGELHTAELVGKAVIETPFCSWSTIGLAELLIGEDPRNISYLWDKMYKYTSGFGRRGIVLHAISAIDMALWDILGKSCGLPIYQLLGGAHRKSIKLYASDLDPDGKMSMSNLAQRHVDNGYKAMKFGWGGLGKSLKDDVKAVAAVRECVGPDIDIMFDFGHPLPLDRAIRFARDVDPFNVYFIEEPLEADDFGSFRKLVAASPTPIATGEKLATLRDFAGLIDHGDLRIIQPDIARVGGFTEMLRIAAYADLHNVEIIPHCWASDILVAASLHFMAAARRSTYLEFCVFDQPLRRYLAQEPIAAKDGYALVPEKPGLGVELNDEIVKKYQVH
ncbi:MAG: mandelate racemase/muconate lactonizing enzyme family protein [Pseudomonadota bacterium]